MMKYICILSFLLLLFSCASRKKSDRELSVSSVSGVDMHVDKGIISDIHESIWNKIVDEEDIDIRILEYDTTAQPDSSGNYPLKSDTNITSKRKTKKDQEKETNTSVKENTEADYKENNQEDVALSEVTDDVSDVGSPFNLNWLWFLIIPAAIILICKKFILKK